MNLKLYAPRIHLFAFHLFKTPDVGKQGAVENPDLLWQRCDDIFAKFYIKQQLPLKSERPHNQRFELLAGNEPKEIVLEIQTAIYYQDEKLPLDGFVYPLQLYDSYGLGFTIGFPEPELNNGKQIKSVDVSVLKQLNPDYCFLPDKINSNWGQTLIITSWLAEDQRDDKSLKKLADECIGAFVIEPSKVPSFHRQGKLFGSPIFEYGLINDQGRYRHILVWLFSKSITDKNLQKSYTRIVDLFYYRNKIITEFQNSRSTYLQLYKKYEETEKFIQELFLELSSENTLSQKELNYLKNKLKELVKENVSYSSLLRDLEFSRNSIIIHTDNYNSKLNFISNHLESESDLSFLEAFSQENCRTYQEQIQGDLGYFVQGSSLLEKAINSIRGIVAIDQAERDRKREDREKESDRQLQLTIFAASAGVTVGGIVASSSGQITEQNPIKWNVIKFHDHPIHPFTVLVFFSIVAGLVAGGIAWWLTKQWHKCRH
ncbi:MAG: hypothetical protein F6K36_05210 [Symploca sp. SIO3C6]|nr:hypothetical protein [Symploca sp. SIO3C6]